MFVTRLECGKLHFLNDMCVLLDSFLYYFCTPGKTWKQILVSLYNVMSVYYYFFRIGILPELSEVMSPL